ncbi:MAG: polyprenyl synthetase family protein [Rhodothermales bacterium]|nr:polyprenyl synthetase family protein [Rhodothermales bacterium]
MTDAVLTVPPPSKVSVTLNDLRKPVEKDLREFETYFKNAMSSNGGLLDLIVRYLLRRKGKQLRPILVLLSAKMCGETSKSSYLAAALVELLHTATLVHDDVVDTADQRRGAFSINALWKNKIAVLFGDFLLSRGLLLALDNKEYDLLHTMSDAVRRMSEGEILQIEKSRKLDIDEETYYKIISDKTASLIAACTTAGARSVTTDDEVIDRMNKAGESLGLAFQIRDDLFDYGIRDVGKPLGIDLKERKLTLPLIFSLSGAESSEQRRILKLIRKKRISDRDIRYIADFVTKTGGIEYAKNAMIDHAQTASRLVGTFPQSEARDTMMGLIDYTVQRKL